VSPPGFSMTEKTTSRGFEIAVLIALTALAIALRLHYITQPVRYDEALTYLQYASKPLGEALSHYGEPNNHLLNTALVHLAVRVFGNEPWVLRIPAFLAGVLIVPATFWASRKLYGGMTALLAAALVAVSASLIEYSVLARGYSFITFFFVTLIGLAAVLKNHNRPLLWGAFGLIAALGLYAIPVMVYPLGAVALWLLLSIWLENTGSQRAKLLWSLFLTLAAAALLTIALYLPVILNDGLEALTSNAFVTPPPPEVFYQQLPEILRHILRFPTRGFPDIALWALAAGTLISLIAHRRIAGHRLPVIIAAAAWILPVLFLQRVIPFDRTWLFLMPLYAIAGAAGWTFLVRRSPSLHMALIIATAAIAVVVVESEIIPRSEQTGNVPDAQAMALWLIENAQPEDQVLAPVPVDEPLRYYLNYFGRPDIPVLNQYQTSWIDIRRHSDGKRYVMGVEPGDPADFVAEFYLETPSFEFSLQPVQTFASSTAQTLTLDTLPQGVLFEMTFPSAEMELVTMRGFEERIASYQGETVLDVQTGDEWGELLLNGSQRWTDYAVEVVALVVRPGREDMDDLQISARYRPQVGAYNGSISVGNGRARIGADGATGWRGILNETPVQLAPGHWYTLRLQTIGDQIDLYVNNARAVSVEDSELTDGTVRLLFPPETHVYIKELRVYDVSPRAMATRQS